MVLSRRLPSSLVYTIGRSQYHATGALARTQRCCGRDTPPLDPRYKNMTSLTKPEVYITYRNAARRKPSHGYGRGNRHRRLGEVWSCVVPGICERAHRQTDRHAHHNTPLPSWDGVINCIRPLKLSLRQSQQHPHIRRSSPSLAGTSVAALGRKNRNIRWPRSPPILPSSESFGASTLIAALALGDRMTDRHRIDALRFAVCTRSS